MAKSIKNNPFVSNEFVSVWLKHFNQKKASVSFNFIKDIAFVKNKYIPLYTNVGKNLTNGISYTLNTSSVNDIKNKAFLLLDIPDYIETDTIINNSLKVKKVRQYKGYLANLQDYTNIETYIKDNFSSKSKGVFAKCIRRLELSFNIKYTMYYGDNITKDQYNFIFKHFNKLLIKRYTEKQVSNHYLSPEKWNYLYELVYPMILAKKATLFVIFRDNVPITVSLNYISESTAFGALTVFDTNYSKFNIGFIDIIKHLEWCIKEKIQIFDFSKGDFDYKKRWGNTIYNFEYHIIYNPKSITSKIIAYGISKYFLLKQYLREQDLHTRFHKLTFFLKRGKKNISKNSGVTITPINDINSIGQLTELNFDNVNDSHLIELTYNFLFKYSESVNNVLIYKITGIDNSYLIAGKSKNEKITFK